MGLCLSAIRESAGALGGARPGGAVLRHFGADVDHGDTVTDFLPLERERGITIQSAAISFHWPPQNRCPPGTSPKTINLIDTPGHQDFRFEVDRCLPVLDGAVCILDSVQGVEAHTERVWASAQDYSVPRIVYVNKLDRDGASFKKSVLDIASRLNAWPLVCQIPLWDKESLVGVVDVVRRIGLRWSSAGKCVALQEAALRNTPGLWEEIERARSKLVDKLCEDDDALVEEFAQGSDVSADSIKRSIRRAISSGDGKLVPIFAGSSLRNMGVEPLLDAIVDYLPHPQEGPGDSAVGSGDPKREANAKAGSKHRGGSGHQQQIGGVASVFKVVNDTKFFPDVHGMMTFVRVKEGTLYKNSLLTNLNLGPLEKPERPLNIMQVSASKVSHIPHIGPGQIGAIEGLKSARTGDTLVIWPSHSHAHRSPGWTWDRVQQRPLTIAPAVAFISIEPYRLSDVKGLEIALAELSREDPSLRWSKDEKTDTFVLSGMGKLHLEIAVDRLKTNYKSTGAIYGQIEVDYKECLVAPTGLHRYVYDRVVASKSGRAACTASLRPIDKHQRQELVSGDSRESNGNVFDIKLVGGTDSSTSDTALLSEQLFKRRLRGNVQRAAAGLPSARLPRQSHVRPADGLLRPRDRRPCSQRRALCGQGSARRGASQEQRRHPRAGHGGAHPRP